MPNIGPLEIAIVLIIALVIFGPARLPDLGKSAGKGLREFKESVTGSGDSDKDSKESTVQKLESGTVSAPKAVKGEVVAATNS